MSADRNLGAENFDSARRLGEWAVSARVCLGIPRIHCMSSIPCMDFHPAFMFCYARRRLAQRDGPARGKCI